MNRTAFILILLFRGISLAQEDTGASEGAASQGSQEYDIVDVDDPLAAEDDDSEDDDSESENHESEVGGHTHDVISHEDIMKLHSAWDADNDGKVSMSEVLSFASNVHKTAAKKNVESSLRIFDTSKDGQLSLEEVLAGAQGDSTESDEEDDSNDPEAKEKVLKAVEARKQFEIDRFKAADVDSDGVLTDDEISHFFHPETHHESLKLMAMDTLKRRDTDGNGKLSESEFLQNVHEGLHELDKDYDGHKEVFKKLDKDGDGHLDVHELMPWESGMSHVEHAMGELFEHADEDKDGHVSAEELAKARVMLAGSDAHHYLTEWTAHAHSDL